VLQGHSVLVAGLARLLLSGWPVPSRRQRACTGARHAPPASRERRAPGLMPHMPCWPQPAAPLRLGLVWGAPARGSPAVAGARTPPERALSGARPRRRRRRRSWSGWSTRRTARRSAWRAPAGRASAGSARRAAPRRPRDPRPPALSRRPQALQSAPARSRAVGRTCAAATPVRAARRRAACCLGTELRLRMAGRLLRGGCDHARRAAGRLRPLWAGGA